MKKHAIAVALLALSTTVPAFANGAGSWIVKGGVMGIFPDVDSGDLSAPSQAGSRVDVSKSSVRPAGGITYMVTDHWAIELPLALPFEYDIKGAGTIDGVGKVGDTKALPATVFGQYHFGDTAQRLRPYVGVGLTYAYFFDERGNGTLSGLTNPGYEPTKMNIDSKFAVTPQLGLAMRIDQRWFGELMVAKTFLKTDTQLSTGQEVSITLDPWTVAAFVGYRF